ncbi:MAG: P1 family peptidase [Solobacterium sp.]|nr:P1 family peptidase [Solobacterium sp.]
MNSLKEIKISDIKDFRIGSAEDLQAATGCTVILSKKGALTACDVRGAAPASRENALLDPLASNNAVNAVVLSGGSAFGLACADGVMRFLEERNIGFRTSEGVVPIVCASCIYDLAVGSSSVRPDAAMGYKACENAQNDMFREGSYGAGCGASAGKIMGMDHAMKTGLGFYGVEAGGLYVAAVTAANPLGDIYEYTSGKRLAGCTDPASGLPVDSEAALVSLLHADSFNKNTTIACIMTNADLTKADLKKCAGMAHDGMARSIRPVHTSFDGDSVYVMSTCTVPADVSTVGTLAAYVLSRSIERAAVPDGETFGLLHAQLF